MTRARCSLAVCLLHAACFFQPMEADRETIGPTASETTTTGPDPTTTDTTAVCGNYDQEPGEECDNGDENGAGGLCRADCLLNQCGDDYVADFSEACDDGNQQDGDGCSAECKVEACGDGQLQSNEECDDANLDDTDACTSLCRDAECGDGLVFADVEACDDGNPIDTDACTNACAVPVCGDGLVSDGEQCDDDNMVDDDACSNLCQQSLCGDGVANEGEECDDANGDDLDACSNECEMNVCGDGVINNGEQCDDLNAVDTDACLSTCQFASCGDGFVHTGVEECDSSVNTCEDCQRTAFLVFVTSLTIQGDEIQNPAMADAICTELAATNPEIAGNYKAWLSEGGDEATNRLFHSPVPYILPNGTQVASNWNTWASDNHAAPVDRTETGNSVLAFGTCANPGPGAVWTGTDYNGSNDGNDCNGWLNNRGLGHGGLLTVSGGNWNGCNFNCNISARLYCLEQP
jgi:cysteine-rich repeat protein